MPRLFQVVLELIEGEFRLNSAVDDRVAIGRLSGPQRSGLQERKDVRQYQLALLVQRFVAVDGRASYPQQVFHGLLDLLRLFWLFGNRTTLHNESLRDFT